MLETGCVSIHWRLWLLQARKLEVAAAIAELLPASLTLGMHLFLAFCVASLLLKRLTPAGHKRYIRSVPAVLCFKSMLQTGLVDAPRGTCIEVSVNMTLWHRAWHFCSLSQCTGIGLKFLH